MIAQIIAFPVIRPVGRHRWESLDDPITVTRLVAELHAEAHGTPRRTRGRLAPLLRVARPSGAPSIVALAVRRRLRAVHTESEAA